MTQKSILTWARKLEAGRPLSRAKANIWREEVAMLLIQAQTAMMMRMAVMADAAPLEPVTLANTVMNGNPVGEKRAESSVSSGPKAKQNVMSMTKPSAPLR